MKNKNIITLIITIVVAVLILGYIYLNKQNENLTVQLYYTGDLEFDFEANSYKYNKIELTDEQQKEIIKFYKKTNIKKSELIDLAVIGRIKLEFSDGNIIAMDEDSDSYGYINKDYCIRLSNGFKEYILNIID